MATVEGLKAEGARKDAEISQLIIDLHTARSDMNKAKREKQSAIDQLAPFKDSLNKLTAERGKWLKKLKRAGIKT